MTGSDPTSRSAVPDSTRPSHRVRRPGRLAVLAAVAVALVLGAVGSRPAAATQFPFPGFPDVRPGAFHEPAAYWLREVGLTTGVGRTGDFQPDRPITRGEVTTFFWRIAGEPAVATPAGFVDTDRGAFYDAAVRWLTAAGHTTGVGGSDRFEPDRSITRGEVAALWWRIAGEPAPPGPAPFVDVRPDVYYTDAIAWLAARGLTTGVGGSDRFEPERSITRGEFATLLWRDAGSPPVAVPGLISSFSTPLVPGQSRNTNIAVSAAAMNGRVIRTGESFSMNEALGPRTRERGYVANGAIVGGSTVTAIGGGVSQTSTTFLNAAWEAGIRLDFFRPHTRYFERYPMCREATIVWPDLDLVVTNDSFSHLWIEAWATDSQVTVRMHGFPTYSVESWTGAPYSINRATGAFSVDCRRTVRFLGQLVRTEDYSWRYVNGGFPG